MRVTSNAYGVKIYMCCASCRFKDATRLMTKRLCTKTNQDVDPEHSCDEWRMNDQMKLVGSAKGQVKKREYLMYILKIREAEDELREKGEKIEAKSVELIREEFEQVFGSIFMDL